MTYMTKTDKRTPKMSVITGDKSEINVLAFVVMSVTNPSGNVINVSMLEPPIYYIASER